MKQSLTPRQFEFLQYLRKRLAEREVGPSYDEMAQEAGVSSKSGVHALLVQLEVRGYVKRYPNARRRIALIEGEGK